MPKIIIVLVVALLLAGCGADITPEGKPSNVNEITKTLDDGRTVVCLIYASGYRGGLSCDWGGAS